MRFKKVVWYSELTFLRNNYDKILNYIKENNKNIKIRIGFSIGLSSYKWLIKKVKSIKKINKKILN